MMEWGLREVDKAGVESYIDASILGRPIYEACGYTAAPVWTVDFREENPSAEWLSLQQMCLPFDMFPMWRPRLGRWNKDTRPPWLECDWNDASSLTALGDASSRSSV